MNGDDLGGELIVCPSKTNNSADFVLWWLGKYDISKNDGSGQYYIPVDKIEVNGDTISFIFTGQTTKDGEKTLTLDRWAKSNVRDKGISNLNGQVLKEVCKLEGDKLDCSSKGYKQEKLTKYYFYF
ncbi:hypothetical protein OVS_03555 [Mycoplasma ovis str. Michigan]|uniref:Uncharacterized protein n=1 Tax=Mycoplasma ovis str. Michigan TaxID=1415773 RepID=A0ABM5P2A1_9MOLU|nr:hypothetical protein [Mycoplasma ovis]AHC40460.1 hypothetical protein OVS_03555 [Mycoplasma ovis str. Michigan]